MTVVVSCFQELGVARYVGGIQKSEPFLILGIERDLGKELAHDLLHVIERGLLLIDGGEDEGVLAVAERHGVVEGLGSRRTIEGGMTRLPGGWPMICS